MKFNLENFLELDTMQLLAVNGGSGCGGSSGGGSSSGGASSSSTSSGGGASSGGGGGSSCGGSSSSSSSIGSEGLTITPKDGFDITVGANVTLGYTPDKGNFDIDADQGTVTVKTPVGTFSAELESVTVKVKVDY